MHKLVGIQPGGVLSWQDAFKPVNELNSSTEWDVIERRKASLDQWWFLSCGTITDEWTKGVLTYWRYDPTTFQPCLG